MTNIEDLQDCVAEIANLRYRLDEIGIQNPHKIIELCKELEELLEKEVSSLRLKTNGETSKKME